MPDKNLQKLLKESEERLKKVADNAHEWIWEVDKTGLYTYSSRVVEDILGYRPAELVGKKHIHELFIPQERDSLKKEVFTAFEKRRSLKGFVSKNIHKKGQEVNLSANMVPIMDSSGNLKGYLGLSIETCDEEGCSGAKLKGLLDKSAEGVVVFQGFPPKIVFSNNSFSRIIGYSNHQLLMLSPDMVSELIHPDDRAVVMWRLKDCLDEKDTPSHYEYRAIRRDKSVCLLEMTIGRITYQGKPAVQGTVVDITERRKAEEFFRKREDEVEKLRSISIGRELRMVELKKKIKELEEKLKKSGID